VNIGFDMDGVIASRPRIFKLNSPKGKYRVKLSWWEQWFWRVVMLARSPSNTMVNHAQKLKKEGNKLNLISGRLAFLEDLTLWWLSRHNLADLFDNILVNSGNVQPHEFKIKEIKRLKIDRFYEDELFTAKYINENSKAKVYIVIANGEEIRELT
jgi:uncharacterized HAD superfamily protein